VENDRTYTSNSPDSFEWAWAIVAGRIGRELPSDFLETRQ
jgi:hypothetical protein